MTTLNKILQGVCGIEAIAYESRLGHSYCVNNLGQTWPGEQIFRCYSILLFVILTPCFQEMCNPKVRPHRHFYPEATRPHLRETRQAERWLKEVPAEDTTPMVCLHKSDYIYEPAMLDNQSVCIPHSWFTCDGKFYAKAWMVDQILSRDNGPIV